MVKRTQGGAAVSDEEDTEEREEYERLKKKYEQDSEKKMEPI